jgi:hypothetical protein
MTVAVTLSVQAERKYWVGFAMKRARMISKRLFIWFCCFLIQTMIATTKITKNFITIDNLLTFLVHKSIKIHHNGRLFEVNLVKIRLFVGNFVNLT